jgi:sulfoxide reductase heme-binding subunit YedZ
MTVDPFNRGREHATVVAASLALAGLLWVAGYETTRILAAVPWFLLFLVMVIGPVTRIRPSIRTRYEGNFPLTWRSELGIWFVVWSLIHVVSVFRAFGWGLVDFVVGMSPWAFAATVALLIGVVLAFTSNERAYRYLGPKAWKWHQSHGTYVMFWLLAVHIYDQIFVRGGGVLADPLHLVYLLTILIVVALHVVAFATIVRHYREHGEYPGHLR